MQGRSGLILTFRFRVRDQWAASQRASSTTLGTMWCGPYTYWYISPAVNHSCSPSATHDKSMSHSGGSPGQYSIIFQATTHHPATSRYWLKKNLTEDLGYKILHNESLEVTWKLIMRWDASGYILIKEKKQCSDCWLIFHQQQIIMLDVKEKKDPPSFKP